MSFRFRHLLLLYVSVLTFLLTAAIVGLYTVRFREQAVADLTEYGKTITVNTSFSLADDLFAENYAPLQEFVEEFSSQRNVAAIEISDQRGNILAASELEKLGTRMRQDPVDECLAIEQGNICVRVDSDHQQLVVTAPIMIEELGLGSVRVHLSMQEMLARTVAVQRQGVLAGFLCWVLAVLLGFFVMHRLGKPVRKFVEATEGISRGEFDVDVPTPRWVVEFEKFAEALKVMAKAIASREQELRESEKKFRHLFEHALEGIFVADNQGLILEVNPAFMAIFGAPCAEDLLGRNIFVDFFLESTQAQGVREQIAARGFVTSHELEMKNLAGITITAELSCHAVGDESGAVAAYEGMIRDISSRKAAQREITRMRNYLTNIIESMPSVLVTVDENGIISQWNSAAAQLLGVSQEMAVGRGICEVAPFFSKYDEQFAEIVRDRRPLKLHREQLCHDGERNGIYSLTLFPLVANGANGVAIRLDDITELDAKEQQLRQAQKMESIGTLAGGLAHDFNNVLGGVLGNLSLVEYRLAQEGMISPETLRDYLERMTTAANRAVDLVRQLLTLSRRQDINLVPVDLNLSIKHVLKICENTFDKSVRIAWHPAPAAAIVLADPTQIEQVILNLCINAGHAMTLMRGEAPWGGVLTIDLEGIEVDEAFQRTHPEARLGHCWRLTVSDNGVGMNPLIIDKIFDPFFTTKEKGVGTGLGLAMAYNIVTQLGGFVDVSSEVAIGSTFNVYLPLLERKVQAVAAAGVVPLARGQGLVLVVDDDEPLRELSREILESIGYRVLTANDGREGVDLYRQHQAQVVAVLLDMVMPVLAGREAYLEMKKINGEVKVVVTSGFRQDDRIDEMLRLGVMKFLQKPYTMEKLGLALQEVIGS